MDSPEPTAQDQTVPATPQRLEQIDVDEDPVAVIRRHPFGLVVLYFQVVLGLAAASTLAYLLIPEIFGTNDVTRVRGMVAAGIFVVAVALVVVLLIITVLYRVSRLIVTTKTITQVLQDGLFNRKVSQLSIADIEDVTADKRGVFPTIFNYGALNIETAGEQINFHFTYCPNPNYYARQILEASERFKNDSP